MAKIKLTRPELKRQRDALKRFQRFLPMLKLRQSQLQSQINKTRQKLAKARDALAATDIECRRFAPVLRDAPGLDLERLLEPTEVKTRQIDIAGIAVEELDEVNFPAPDYSLLTTPVWVDGAITTLQKRRRQAEELRVFEDQHARIQRELRKTIQRVNLFEQVMIPDAKDAIRRIRIRLGDEMTSAIGRGKIAKSKLADLVVDEAAAELSDAEDEDTL
jgi:V/A-type H+-transporting ATPase subunit D